MKNAVVDDREVFLGSMNLDPRSAKLNTELGLIILRLSTESGEIEWVRDDGAGAETAFRVPPETTGWQRLKLQLLGPFIPEKDL